MGKPSEYVIDGDAVNTMLRGYGVSDSLLAGQVFELVEKKLVHRLLEEIDRAKPHVVRFVNLESIPNGPYADFAYAIFGGLTELVDSLGIKQIRYVGTINDPTIVPQNIVSVINKASKTSEPVC